MLVGAAHTVEVSTDLVEDYEQSTHPAAGPDVTDRFRAIRRTTRSTLTIDLISVHPDGGLLRVFSDS